MEKSQTEKYQKGQNWLNYWKSKENDEGKSKKGELTKLVKKNPVIKGNKDITKADINQDLEKQYLLWKRSSLSFLHLLMPTGTK